MTPESSRAIRLVKGVTNRADGSMKDESARRMVLQRAGLEGRPAFTLHQVHGVEILAAEKSVPAEKPKADGWVSDAADDVLCVYAADCMPIFIWEKNCRAAGVFHSGWRGTAAGMPKAAVEAFRKHYGIEPKDLRAQIGPYIHGCCYSVGPDTARQFRTESVEKRGDSIFLDIGREAVAQLKECGVESVELSPDCTSCRRDAYFSYRRDRTDERMMAFISLISR